MLTDPISDMLIRIKNASAVKKIEVVLPYSKVKWAILKILKENKYIKSFDKINKGKGYKEFPAQNYEQIKIVLLYDESRDSAFKHLKRVSKPGRRVYAGKNSMPVVLNHLGIAVVSTPQGIMTNKEARKKGVGGEIICEVY